MLFVISIVVIFTVHVLALVTLLAVNVLPDKLQPVPDTVAPVIVYPLLGVIVNVVLLRSEERRVGKEC